MKVLSILFFLFLSLGAVQAGEIRGKITKQDGKTVEITTKKGRVLTLDFDKHDILLKGVKKGDKVRVIIRELSADDEEEDEGC